MKKTLLLVLMLPVFLFKLASAQELTVNGTVKDKDGNALPLAFVQDKSNKTAARADSSGKFTLKANSNSTLLVTAAGYESKVVALKGKTELLVILEADKGTGEVPAQIAGQGLFNDYNASNGAASAVVYGGRTSGTLPVFHPLDDTKGSRYLFKDWVSGFVVSPQDSVYKNPNYGFNYDKMNGGLLLTQDKKSVIEIDQSRIKSFTLYDNLGRTQVFEYAPEIDKTHYPQVLASGSKYKIYKLTTTKFVKANYQTDGMTSTGNNYDEYVDEDTYYVLNVQTKQLQPLGLKKKAIKTAFANEGNKINSFFEAYTDKIDDSYLKKLGDYMNQ